ncbi:MAG: hypothetical protein DI598_04205 [Pseudopedobacter saltans]|uniref:DUF418 domain-containing protein n=1 Tax=Pseudopedobacter saltans TaxID=151895 RepID=A0A2W5F856_9SPHI|nr:MAG: hypothetical protein DI598_04205 [Pseudopedobacter saltans]
MTQQSSTLLKPVSEKERLFNMDVLRGFALLGILLMNIPFFALPSQYSLAWNTNTHNINFWFDTIITIFFEGKMRALFSLLFGVGILLFTANKEGSGKQITWLYYRRMLWLCLFGLIDAHVLLWMGDILFLYGLCGSIAYLFRKMKPIYLALGVPIAIILGFTFNAMYISGIRTKLLNYNAAQSAIEKKMSLSNKQKEDVRAWEDFRKEQLPDQKEIVSTTAKMKSGYASVASVIRPQAFLFETTYLFFGIWDPLVLMLFGMALYKWGFFSNTWQSKTYKKLILLGYSLGLPLVIYSYYFSFTYTYSIAAKLSYLEKHPILWTKLIYDFQRLLLMMAHASVIILIIRSKVLTGLTKRLAAVGRMAFTNYIMHTVICTTLFFGYGFNLFGDLEYYQLYAVVLAIWLFQLWISPIWLKYNLFGPLEWVWRSLTYWKKFPLKRKKEYETNIEEVKLSI